MMLASCLGKDMRENGGMAWNALLFLFFHCFSGEMVMDGGDGGGEKEFTHIEVVWRASHKDKVFMCSRRMEVGRSY